MLAAFLLAVALGAVAAPAAEAAASLRIGSHGARVERLQARLAKLHYLPAGAVDGAFGPQTQQAVYAFQGWSGLVRDGVVGPLTRARLRHARAPRPWSGGRRHIEVHLRAQVLLLVGRHGRLRRAIHVSTGRPGLDTPAGRFLVQHKEVHSWSVPFHTWLDYASYFSGGYALHQYASVPPFPVSHGCVRIYGRDALVVWRFAWLRTPVVIG
jgi:N-acetylmuramoyl-L-alanine amidase